MAQSVAGPQRRGRLSAVSALVVLCVAQFVLQLDFSIVNVALKTIQSDLGFTETGLQWVVTSYALTFGSLLLLGGGLGDLLGRRRLLIAGLWVFAASSLASGLAQSPAMLICARFVQGAGAAMIAPTVLAILTSAYADGAERTRALGIWTGATAAGGTTGVVLGGVMTQYLGWRSIFLVNLPVIAVLIPLVRVSLPDDSGHPGRKLDAVGAALITGAIAALIFGLTNGEQHGFSTPLSLLSLGGSAVLLAGFVLVELSVAEPMVSFPFLAAPVRRTSALVMLLVGGVMTAYIYFIALYLQRVVGFSEAKAALALAPAPLTLVFTSTIVTRRLIARFGVKAVLLAGLVVMCGAQLWLSRLTASSDYVGHILPAVMTTAFSIGLIFPSVSIGMTSDARPRERGLAGGLVPTSQQVGAAIGLAILATIAAAATSRHGGSLIAGYHASYVTAAVLVALAIAIVATTSFRQPATANLARQ